MTMSALAAHSVALHTSAWTSLQGLGHLESSGSAEKNCILVDCRISENPWGKRNRQQWPRPYAFYEIGAWERACRRRFSFSLPDFRAGKCMNTLADKPSSKGPPDVTVKDLQRYRSLMPPFNSRATQANQLSPRLWTFTQPLGFPSFALDVVSRMTVIQLDDGSLWIHSPIALTAELTAMLKPLGIVKHIVICNTFPEHSIFAGDYVKAFPEAVVYAPCPLDELLTRELVGRVDAILTDEPPPAWAGQIDQVSFQGLAHGVIVVHEFAFHHRLSRTCLTSDTLYYTGPETCPILRPLAYNRLEIFPGMIAVFLNPKYRPRANHYFQVIDSWDCSTLVISHWLSPVPNAKEELRGAVTRVFGAPPL